MKNKHISKTALELLRIERERQVKEEGWTPEHDAGHKNQALACAAAAYATPFYLRADTFGTGMPDIWPWDAKWWKPTPDDRVRELVKAGALILAAIERELHKREGGNRGN